MTDEAWGKLSEELMPDERQQLETITRDMQYLKYLPPSKAAGEVEEEDLSNSAAWGVGNKMAAVTQPMATRVRPPSVSELRAMQDTQLAVRQMPRDLRRYAILVHRGEG